MKIVKEIVAEIARAVQKLDLKEASKIIRRSSYDVTRVIDEVAESAALKLLQTQNEFNLLTEESGFHDFSGTKTLVLDPIDGTFNAISGIPFYSVSIAVGKAKLSDVEYGFVKNLATGEEFEAERDKGAWLNRKPIKVKKFNPDYATFSVYLGKYATRKSYEFAHKAKRIRFLGCASLDLCLVANGTFDAYCQCGYPLRITDLAAGALILREAGGEIYDDNFNTLEMDFKLSDRKNVLACGAEKVLELVR